MCISDGGCDTHVTFNDMLPALLPSLPHASVIHKGLHFPEGHWTATSLKWGLGVEGVLPPLSITNKQEVGLWGYADSCYYDPVSGGNGMGGPWLHKSPSSLHCIDLDFFDKEGISMWRGAALVHV